MKRLSLYGAGCIVAALALLCAPSRAAPRAKHVFVVSFVVAAPP